MSWRSLPFDAATATPVTAPNRAPPSWRALHADDDFWGESLQFEHWRAASPALKMRELAALSSRGIIWTV